MVSREDVLAEIEREISSFQKRKWLRKEWTEENIKRIQRDLDNQKVRIENKPDDFFENFDDVYDALNAIDDEIDEARQR